MLYAENGKGDVNGTRFGDGEQAAEAGVGGAGIGVENPTARPLTAAAQQTTASCLLPRKLGGTSLLPRHAREPSVARSEKGGTQPSACRGERFGNKLLDVPHSRGRVRKDR